MIWRREALSDFEPDTGYPGGDPLGVPGGLRSRIYQRRANAKRFALIVEGRMAEATGRDPKDYACCSGRECGCHGETNAEVWARRVAEFPRLMEGPTIQCREVGDWVDAEPQGAA